ncbi:hypothetical protein [Acinetobacter sp. ANC 4648]|uniref:hypothetical protein n=1 Tax=Acinetobacter sp. ANC 4648 TaxID=1977875 RepID=UPI000A3580F0|nr:hypothetical protein [Acinetobacter sp. ANC 4648]OTG82308.1 hypothetical protein B9T27_08700 [Acinetobacter sp. ANC 4648]
MNNISISSPNNRLIKSWFGFFLGAILVGISLVGLSKNLTVASILSTLGFLCFWYPWSQMTGLGWNNPMKNFFKADNQAISKPCTYLTLIATILLISSTVIRFMN